MNWYKGNVAEAVARSKVKNAIFVVFVEGKDENSSKLIKFIDEEKIRTKLESEDFVAIKINSESESYMQFATIYQVVPVPSIFFIGKTGTPIEIGTGALTSAEDLEKKIENVLSVKKGVSAASSAFIATEQASSNTVDTEAASAKEQTSNEADEVVVCEGDVCYKVSSASGEAQAVKTTENKPQAASTTASADVEERVEATRKMLEQKRRERIAVEQKAEQERELQRRKLGKDIQNQQQWQKEQELKELKENLRRDRLEEQATRERIRAQIAADRAERAHKFPTEIISGGGAANANSGATKPTAQANDMTRLQFRLSTGESKMHSFNCQVTLNTVRDYVKSEILPGSGIRGDFILATTFPRCEFTAEHETKTLVELELFPSAVILVIGKESKLSPNSIIARSGGLVNMFTTLFWAVLSPVYAVFGFLKNAVVGRAGNNRDKNVGIQKRANEDQNGHNDAVKRRNLDRFLGTNGPSTSKEAAAAAEAAAGGESKPYRRYGSSNVHRLTEHRKDSDDENATWNGNSTQQQ